MKKLFPICLFLFALLLTTCEDCEVISSETEPAVPLVDCPALALNIGDACDDDNPDTSNDTVQADCTCLGSFGIDCPDLGLNIGDACDDGNPDTTNDTVDENCNCTGTLAVDCPDLGLNIGDMCDDGNPDTTNDLVDANCVCVGQPINTCEGAILVMRAAVENNTLGNLFLDRADIAPLNSLNFTQLTPIIGSPIQTGSTFPFSFSTINPEQNGYFYGFQYSSTGVLNPLLQTSTDGSFSPSFLLSELPYAAPIYHQGKMYAIDVVYDDPTVQYAILEINLFDGQISTLFSGSTTVNSQVVNPVFFSASNGSNKVFFLAGTSLFEYNVNVNAVTEVLLVPEPDPDMPVVYTGVEYRPSSNELLVLRHQAMGSNIESTLVSISQDGNFFQNDLVSINGFLFFQDAGILHSTAYDSCNDKYYISTPVALEQEVFESYLIEIEVAPATVESRIFPDFLFGLETELVE